MHCVVIDRDGVRTVLVRNVSSNVADEVYTDAWNRIRDEVESDSFDSWTYDSDRNEWENHNGTRFVSVKILHVRFDRI